jgi:hypothetical protein
MGQPNEKIVGGDDVSPKYSIPYQVTQLYSYLHNLSLKWLGQ